MGILLGLFVVIVAVDPFVPHHDLFLKRGHNHKTIELKISYRRLSSCSFEKNIVGGWFVLSVFRSAAVPATAQTTHKK